MVPVCPDRYFTKIRYSDINNVASGSGFTNIYRGNGPFDPEQPLGGQQPQGFDQLMALYRQYRVHASSIVIEMVTTSDSSNAKVPYLITLRPNNTQTSLGRLPETEAPYTRWRCVPGTQTTSVKLFSKITTKKLFGLKSIAEEESFTGTSTSDPATQWYWLLSVSSMDGVSTQNYSYIWRITYFIEFFDRRSMAQSLEEPGWTHLKDKVTHGPLPTADDHLPRYPTLTAFRPPK
jgi:hypothetical protein